MATHCVPSLQIRRPSHPLGRGTQVTKAVSSELQAAKADGFTQSEANVGQVDAVANEREF
jgi:hypothetical protein